ncbi:hypothetical protein BDR06DRAFT_963312 [Suillus hirtellus]|nr:hypothetical protein BDR06DRAFT_963312 [Suillus hirtellus]
MEYHWQALDSTSYLVTEIAPKTPIRRIGENGWMRQEMPRRRTLGLPELLCSSSGSYDRIMDTSDP